LTKQKSSLVVFTDLGIAEELKDKEFRNQFFRTEREIDIPAQIKALRKFRRMTQKKLAESAGTKQSAVSRLEKSQEANWELETLVKLAEALDSRLSVVIEPYEAIVGRYVTAAETQAPSAATAQTSADQTIESRSPAGYGQVDIIQPDRSKLSDAKENGPIQKWN
jgi:transcriptional regulator with XRE-family HTH domain